MTRSIRTFRGSEMTYMNSILRSNFTATAGLHTKRGLTATEQPQIFNYDCLWNHEQPLFNVLNDMYGERPLDSFGGSYGWSVRYRQVEDYEALNINTLRQYLSAFEAGNAQLPYLRHLSINRAMPELRQHIRLPRAFRPNWANHRLLDRLSGPELFIGQAGTSFGHVHQDQVSVHVGFVQLKGTKEFVVFPPEDGQHLEIFEGRQFPYQLRNSKVRYCDLDDYENHPGLARARPRRIRLREGQALFMPADWWHTTSNLEDSVSFSIRIVNASNARRVISEYLKGLPRLMQRVKSG